MMMMKTPYLAIVYIFKKIPIDSDSVVILRSTRHITGRFEDERIAISRNN